MIVYINNICKKREWDKKVRADGSIYTDHYFTYSLKRKELGKYLNTWFVEDLHIVKEILYTDSLITLKKVDSYTSLQLYNRHYNPLSIIIMPVYKCLKLLKNNKANHLPPYYVMKCHLHSIDDSSYGIWWGNSTIDTLRNKRFELMSWINQFDTKNLLNGEALLNKCIELGANPETKDYD